MTPAPNNNGYYFQFCQVCSDDRLRSALRQDYTLSYEHASIWLTVHFLLRDLLRGTPYRSNFVAYPLIARFVVVLKHFYFLSFIPSDTVFYSLHFSLAYFLLLGAPERRMGGAIAND